MEALEAAMLQSIVEAPLNETKDDMIETDHDTAKIYPRHITTVDEEVVDALIKVNL